MADQAAEGRAMVYLIIIHTIKLSPELLKYIVLSVKNYIEPLSQQGSWKKY